MEHIASRFQSAEDEGSVRIGCGLDVAVCNGHDDTRNGFAAHCSDYISLHSKPVLRECQTGQEECHEEQ